MKSERLFLYTVMKSLRHRLTFADQGINFYELINLEGNKEVAKATWLPLIYKQSHSGGA